MHPAKSLRFTICLSLCAFTVSSAARAADSKPNFVVVFADDLGYGDLSCFGHPTIKTQHLDRMAAEGKKLTQFYVAANVCTPSRAGLMTGRLPIRTGMCSDKRRVLFPDSAGGIPASELTLAEALRPLGYATACVGKWHLGHLSQFLPTNNGFDSYFGIPYSNDMDALRSAPKGRLKFRDPKIEYFNVPLLRNTQQIERPADQTTITRRYTEEAVGFIRKHKDAPFFLYMPHSLPHVPLFRGKKFAGKSVRGLYGDVIEEIDWSVGQILQVLRDLKIDENTLVIFTSDNGPWLVFGDHGGSAGLLREGKGCTFEGGMREPTIAWWPSKIAPGTISTQLGSTLDILPTFVKLAGGQLPTDRVYDGVDLSPVLFDSGSGNRDTMYYYQGAQLFAVRKGSYKAHFTTHVSYVGQKAVTHDPPLLFNLDIDPSESRDIAQGNPEVVAQLRQLADEFQASFEAPPSQLEARISR
jgi:arylsulfatase A